MSTDKQKSDNEKIRAKWMETRAKGKFRYILVNGVLFWGLPAGILFFLITTAYDYFYDYPNFQFTMKNFTAKFVSLLIIWSIGGVIIVWLTWNKREKEFRESK